MLLSQTQVEQLRAEYADRRARAESCVQRWVVAGPNSGLHRPEPWFAERAGYRTELLDSPPGGGGEYWRYGLDVESRVVVAREQLPQSPHAAVIEHFVVYRPDEIELVQYVDGRPVELGNGSVSEGCIQSWEARGGESETKERYDWRDGRLVGITRHDVRHLGPEILDMRGEYRPVYDASGQLEQLIEEEPGQPAEIVFSRSASRRRVAEEDYKRLADVLVTTLERFVRDEGPGSFCLALQYDPGVPLPPTPVLGPAMFAERFDGRADRLWNPAEWPEFAALAEQGSRFLDQPEIGSAIERVAVLGSFDADHCVVVLNTVAKRLNEALADIRPRVVPRFIVYATDVTTADLVENFIAAISPEIRSELEAKQLLPTYC